MNQTKKLKRGGSVAQVYDIVVIAGQSNAVGFGRRNVCDSSRLPGCGGVVDLTKNSTAIGPITNIANLYDSKHNKIKQFSGEWNSDISKRNKIIEASDPLETFINNGTGTISFGMSFAKEYIADREINIGTRELLLVNCAYYGTGLHSGSNNMKWRKPLVADDLTKSLYTKTVQRLRNLKTLLGSANNSRVVAFLWHQGETDRTSVSDANKSGYKRDLTESLTGMRTEIMSIFNSNNGGYTYPILLGGLSLENEFNRITGVRRTPIQNIKMMSRIISELSNPSDSFFINRSAFVSTDYTSFSYRLESNTEVDASGNSIGIRYADGRVFTCATDPTKCEDNSHFSATAYRELGKRYFFIYKGVR